MTTPDTKTLGAKTLGAKKGRANKTGGQKTAPQKKEPRRGLLMVYTGDGKGKTTAALGMVFRALGRGYKVAVVQFIKGRWKTGERMLAETLPGLEFKVMGLGFTWDSEDLAQDKAAAQSAWEECRAILRENRCDLLILDEITYTFQYGFLDLPQVLEELSARPPTMHVVLTGRGAPPELVALADLVTEMKPVKHPFEQGIPAQPGIDF
ncbi:MAG: cob(I)yrinic acid a,c-diamide adenosyltransferase [Deltaproteobacteria bacterium]|nr:cob(I)yrinic acid a,c-diamide adenosyltransferase [Deltaproteobacteria bacterium]